MNKGELTSRYNKIIFKKKTSRTVYNNDTSTSINNSSGWYVSAPSKSKFNWQYTDTQRHRYRTYHIGGLWLESERENWHENTHDLANRRLFDRLKREYEKEQKEQHTLQSKCKCKVELKGRTRTVNHYKLMDGLGGHDYSKIYG